MKFSDIISLIRPHQWYKNLVIFLAIIFSANLLNYGFLWITFLGFLVLILISSTNYILNDMIDYKKDRLNPEKSKRPIASGKVSISFAIFLFILFIILGLIFAFILNKNFFYITLGIFIISTCYSLFLKHLVFADIIAISSNFVLRAVAGAILINVFISSWLIFGVFFLAMFLVSGKRYGEINYLKDDAKNHRKVLESYSKDLLHSLFSIFLAVLIMVFSLYTFSSEHKHLFWVTPLFLYIVLRYYFLILSNNKIVRNPETAIYDIPLVIASILFLIICIIIIML